MSASKYVIFNADDFGYSDGINRGIVLAHTQGVVTSATAIVNAPRSAEAADIARAHPKLAVGLNVNFTNEADRLIDLRDTEAFAQLREGDRVEGGRIVDREGNLVKVLDPSGEEVHRVCDNHPEDKPGAH